MNSSLASQKQETESLEPIETHPSLDTWIDYYAKRVTEEEAADLRQHLTHCRRCLDLILDLDAFTHPSASSEGASDFEKATIWRLIRQRLEPRARNWPTVAAIAASMIFAVMGVAQRNAKHESDLRIAELTRPQPNLVIEDLRPGARERSSGGVDVTTELDSNRAVTLVLHLEDEVDHPAYELRILDAAGVEVQRIMDLSMTEFGNFVIGLPAGSLGSGEYDLALLGLTDDREELLETYPIRFH